MKTQDTDKKRIDRDQIWCILSFAGVMILIGVPTWWKCTKVYRVDLPYDQIQTELFPPEELPAKVIFISEDVSADRHQFPIALRDALIRSEESLSLYKIGFSARGPNAFESDLIQNFDIKLSDSSFISRQHNVNEGTLLIYYVPKINGVLIGNGRSVYIGSDVKASDVASVVKKSILGESVLVSSVISIQSDKKLLENKLNLRRVPASADGYDILFTLLNPEPDRLNAEWDIKKAVDLYVDPFTSHLSNLSSFSVKSQMLYMTDLTFPSRSSLEDMDGNKLLSQQDLGLAINSVESRLTSHVSSNPTLNFITYIPKRSMSPLYIESPSSSPSFMLPKWGGVYIYNVERNDSKPSIHIETSKVMEVFLSQLKLLLGIQEESKLDYIKYVEHSGIRLWEKEFLFRLRGMENLLLSRLTLQSLAHLLYKISNIVITDEIGEEVLKSVACFKEGSSKFSSGLIEDGFRDSKCAFKSSEKAFFDPSLLALLYFPEDQKYAIYIPLFLPVGFPVLLSLLTILKFWKSSNSETT
nr:GPI transamidase component PIG-S-like [Lepeophtheirus salmonis]